MPHSFDDLSVNKLVSIVDDFNDEDLTEYTGDTGSFSFNTSDPQEGGASLYTESTGGTDAIESFPGDGLDNYPEPGDGMRVWFRPGVADSGAICQIRIGIGVQPSGTNRYQIQTKNGVGDDFQIWTYVDDSIEDLDNEEPNLSHDTWYQYEILWGDGSGNVSAEILDTDGNSVAGPITTPDDDYSDGGIYIAADARDGNRAEWDYWRII